MLVSKEQIEKKYPSVVTTLFHFALALVAAVAKQKES
jgi:hypothetical protein